MLKLLTQNANINQWEGVKTTYLSIENIANQIYLT